MNKIPKGWEVKKLGEICEITMGQSPKGENVFENSQSLNGLEFHQGKICFTDKFISKSKFITSDIRKIAEVGSILLCVRAPVGVINLTERKIAIGRGLCALKANNQNNNFLYYYLLGLKQYFESKATGSTFSAITLNIVKNCEIPLPPLSEQKAIADKLDDSFAKIENAITNLINAKENLKLYKQSVLKSAFNGDLLPNTSPTQRKKVKFEDVLKYEQPTKYIVKSTKYNNDFKTPVLTAGKGFILGYTNETEGIFTNTPVIIFDDFTTSSQYVNFHFKVKSSAMKILRPVDNVNLKFLFYKMQTIQHKSDTHKRYWISEYAKLEIPLPPLSEQNLIVAEIDRRFAIVDKTLNLIDKSIQNAKNLKQSILKKAFSGELRSEI